MADLAALTAMLHDPSTYVDDVPYAVLAELRREHGIVRVEEPEQAGWPEGPGYWLVLRHVDVTRVLRDPATFSSHLGGTQIRDPATDGDLAYVRRMMLNMDRPSTHGCAGCSRGRSPHGPSQRSRTRSPATRARSSTGCSPGRTRSTPPATSRPTCRS
ncbi:hypothetical protein [Humibacillus xanthopallidus]|uniref:hypothetical protein n=1 Tax=Humibacillus xanthopallidus TaxID=412689 RepID=UPI0038507EAC